MLDEAPIVESLQRFSKVENNYYKEKRTNNPKLNPEVYGNVTETKISHLQTALKQFLKMWAHASIFTEGARISQEIVEKLFIKVFLKN